MFMKNAVKATVFALQKSSLVDGPGIRTTVFFKGCDLDCKWCHNPESKAFAPELLHYKSRCTQCGTCGELCQSGQENCMLCGECVLYCPEGAREICGRKYTVDELFAEIVKDKLFYDTSGGGVTFSGGECMLQIDALEELLKKCKEADISTAVDTAGNVPWEYFERILPYTDLFLYDVKAVSEELHREGTGVSNKAILCNLRLLSERCGGKLLIRIPLIPGFNARDEEIEKIAALLGGIDHRGVELLPYHQMSEHKYEALNIPFTRYPPLEEAELQKYKKLLGLKG